MLSIRRNGKADADIFMASGQPGRIGSGVTVRASSTLASTDLVVRPQHRRGHRPGRDVDDPGQVHPVGHPVIQADQDVQRCRVDLHQVTGRGNRHLPERPPGARCQRPAGLRRPGRVPADLQPAEQTVKRPPRRHRRRLTARLGEDLPSPPENEHRGPRRLVRRLADGLPHGRNHGVARPAVRVHLLAGPAVDHAGQALLLVTPPPLGDRAGSHRAPGGRQFRRLGLFPAGKREHSRVILGPRGRSFFRVRRNPAQHFDDMPLPPPGLLRNLRGQVIQPRYLRHRRARAGIQHREVLR